MMTIAIVEDSPADAEALEALVDCYFEGDATKYKIVTFSDGLFLLEGYRPIYDVIFMDVEMRLVDGLSCARQVREVDEEVPLVYTTRMAQYAVSGYEVGALGYLVKPVSPYSFALTMKRVMRSVEQKQSVTLWLPCEEGQMAVRLRDVEYLEVRGHELIFHCGKRTAKVAGSLKEYAQRLASHNFVLCNRYYLVNLACVRGLHESTVQVGDVELALSRRRKTSFTQAVTRYFQERQL